MSLQQTSQQVQPISIEEASVVTAEQDFSLEKQMLRDLFCRVESLTSFFTIRPEFIDRCYGAQEVNRTSNISIVDVKKLQIFQIRHTGRNCARNYIVKHRKARYVHDVKEEKIMSLSTTHESATELLFSGLQVLFYGRLWLRQKKTYLKIPYFQE